jgi:hypothetical protein
MDPKALRELIPDFEEQGAPLESPVKEDLFSLSHAKARLVRRSRRRRSRTTATTSFR